MTRLKHSEVYRVGGYVLLTPDCAPPEHVGKIAVILSVADDSITVRTTDIPLSRLRSVHFFHPQQS